MGRFFLLLIILSIARAVLGRDKFKEAMGQVFSFYMIVAMIVVFLIILVIFGP